MKFKPNDKSGGVAIELGPGERQLPTEPVTVEKPILPMFHIKKILVPVDFSDCSKKAVIYAAAFAKQFDAELTLLHVVEPYPVVAETGYMGIQAVQEGRRQLEVLRLTIGNVVPVDAIVQTGSRNKGIIETARELASDLIIISTHGHTGLSRVLLGSTAEDVVRHAPCPVLVVREKEREFIQIMPEPENIGVSI